MARARDRQQRGTQYTGVLRGNRPRTDTTATVQHSEARHRFNWRIVSGLIVLCLSGVLTLFFTSDLFYVRSIAVGGLRYMTKEEVFSYADIANLHIFWVEADEVRDNLMRYPTVADVQVRLSWPPNMVNIVIEEREPALVWEQNGVAMWIDVQGRIMSQREDRPDLVRVAADQAVDESAYSDDTHLKTDIVYGTLQLQELRPDVATWRYHPTKGLGFRNDNGWDVWLGVGVNMPEKLLIYEAISDNILARGIQAGEVNIVDPDAPFYTVLWGR